ncbi:methylmalonyl-CoA mutase [candidate division WOR-3 bacterium]|uniref:Methylmalonyl-CoA mutase n=1 Tax=candidate division WOR-3 bacterium TaxID=2052148 RepID=A0A660SLQ2_UNCW3|nr:MAG: methylmalonyl-CoA mutase [candidate division WOR-3 bacterium]
MSFKPYYTPEDLKDFDYDRDLGRPGHFPYTRGVYETMYLGRLWTMRQYAGFGTAEESNRRYRYLLDQGQTGLSVAFDLPTQLGYDSDHPLARGEVGRCGVAIDTVEDMKILFDGIPLDRVSTSMTINATALVLLAMYLVVAEEVGIDPEKLTGTVQNDILKEYIARGNYIYPPRPSIRLTLDLIEFCRQNLPKWNPISISGYHIREAGSNAVQEIAFTLANGIAYLEAAQTRGIDIDRCAERFSFFFGAHNNLLEEVAKFRAARRLWARIIKDRFGIENPKAQRLRFHTQTAGCTLTAQQPENNVVRVAFQALAAVLGGTQSLHTNAKDEALALPTEDSALLALRTQQIIAHESGVAQTIDPLAGSYLIEYLTDQIEKEARDYIDQIDRMGGAIAAVENGFFRREIEDSAYQYQKEVEEKKRKIVGVNIFTDDRQPRYEILKVRPEVEHRQIEQLRAIKKNRDQRRVTTLLSQLKEEAAGKKNLMPTIIELVRVRATLGEISDALRAVFGEYKEFQRL